MAGIDRRKVRNSFHARASEYDRHAVVQKRVLDRLIHLMPTNIVPVRILDIGCGTGALLLKLRDLYPGAFLAGIDMAFGMAEAARCKVAGSHSVQFVTADAESLPFAGQSFDLLLSTSTFQWLEQLEPAFRELKRVLAPGGYFCFALFGEKTLFELKESYRHALDHFPDAQKDRTHNFKCSDDVAAALCSAGLQAEFLISETEIELHPDVPHLLRSIKRIGAGNAAPGSRGGLTGRRVIMEMMEEYERHFRCEGGVPATYEVIYGVGRKI